MKRFVCLTLVLAVLSPIAFGAVVKSEDSENQCTLYQAVNNDEHGHVVLRPGQSQVSSREVYGFSFVDMEVDFDRKEVLVKPMMNIVLGLDKPLLPTKAFIHSDNPDFNFLINQLNRSISLFEKVCVGPKNEIRYAKFFPKRKT